MPTGREAWLQLTKEDVLDPELPICDPHHHFWERHGETYMPEELLRDIDGHRVMETIYIECMTAYRKEGPEEMRPVGETEYVNRIAGQYTKKSGLPKLAAGIVGYADLSLGAAVTPVLEAQLAASRSHFRGIRYVAAWDASPDIFIRRKRPQHYYADAKFREGFACLQRYGLTFDAWLFHPEIADIADLARAFPETTIVLDHIGTPLGVGPYAGKRDEVFQKWRRGIALAAACPNVVVKLGGLGMPISGFGWATRATPPGSAELAEAFAPYFSWCIEKFGADRCMFESNYPADQPSCSYVVLWNAFKRCAQGFSATERAALFRDTARRVYRL